MARMVALLGRNGAGKSTTFRSIIGLVEQRTGPHRVRDQDMCWISRLTRSCEAGSGMCRKSSGYSPTSRSRKNLEVGRQPARPNAPTWDRDKLFALFPNLGEMRGRQGGRMSGGEQQMLTISTETFDGETRRWCCWTSRRKDYRRRDRGADGRVRSLNHEESGRQHRGLSEQNLHFAQIDDLRPRLTSSSAAGFVSVER